MLLRRSKQIRREVLAPAEKVSDPAEEVSARTEEMFHYNGGRTRRVSHRGTLPVYIRNSR